MKPNGGTSGETDPGNLIRVATWLVPKPARQAWEREWLQKAWRFHFDLLRDDVPEPEAQRRRLFFSLEAFRNAFGYRTAAAASFLNFHRWIEEPSAFLRTVLVMLLLLTIMTGGLQQTRKAAAGLPYPAPEQIVILQRTAKVLGMHSSPSLRLTEAWIAAKTPLIHVAAFAWRGDTLQVSDNFFQVLRVDPGSVRSFLGRPVARIAPLQGSSQGGPRYVGAIGRLTDASKRTQAERELEKIGSRKFIVNIEATLLQDRVQRPFLVGLSTFLIGVLIAAMWALVRMLRDRRRSEWFYTYFLAKTASASLLICAAWTEVVSRLPIPENGALTMDALLYLVLLAGLEIGVLVWSYRDQQMRCRQCCSFVALPVTYGTWSSTLLDQPAIEFLCPKGHGTLFEPELAERKAEEPTWTPLDASIEPTKVD